MKVFTRRGPISGQLSSYISFIVINQTQQTLVEHLTKHLQEQSAERKDIIALFHVYYTGWC